MASEWGRERRREREVMQRDDLNRIVSSLEDDTRRSILTVSGSICCSHFRLLTRPTIVIRRLADVVENTMKTEVKSLPNIRQSYSSAIQARKAFIHSISPDYAVHLADWNHICLDFS